MHQQHTKHAWALYKWSIVLAFAVVGPALGADLPGEAPVLPVGSWTGGYGGISLGLRQANNNWRTSDIFPNLVIVQPISTGSMNSAAARVAAFAGYNWQLSSGWIAGVETDVGWANNNKNAVPMPGTAGINGAGCAGTCTGLPTSSVKETWDGSARGRLGTLITPNTLLFGTAGAALQSIELAASCGPTGAGTQSCSMIHNESYTKTKVGWTIGGGIEQDLANNWVSRVDYRYSDFGTFRQQLFNFFVPVPGGTDDRMTANVKVRTHTLNFGFAHKF